MDVRHPLKISLRPVLRNKRNLSFSYSIDGRFSQWTDAYEPLRRHERLDDRTTSLAVAHGMLVFLDLNERTLTFQPIEYCTTSL